MKYIIEFNVSLNVTIDIINIYYNQLMMKLLVQVKNKIYHHDRRTIILVTFPILFCANNVGKCILSLYQSIYDILSLLANTHTHTHTYIYILYDSE